MASEDIPIDQHLDALSVQFSPSSFEAPPGGYFDRHGLETNYMGSTRWAVVLEDVRVAHFTR